ncbi:serine/threonine protein kinase [Reticulomyxa filosa]|uniref:non-specific serine/threonine protein kinase n=1 Tax=Reticulomyxa filosa TaxID=46433 RepID=X6M6H4_RETFI|nr:serine/threonine protein kinase [Reticulomyxa filosa]|eukprot:ETO09593.1 serine/threonine protein kinase [Reticulomyxa filosa]
MTQNFQNELEQQSSYVVALGGERGTWRMNSDSIRDRDRGSTIMVTLETPRWFVDEWEILDPLGAPGAFGIAYSCKRKDSKVNAIYAVKQINKARFYHIGKDARKDILQHMKNEINIQKQLDHPNIVQLYEVYEDRNFLYLVMDYLSG